jgi:hypothetical protein
MSPADLRSTIDAVLIGIIYATVIIVSINDDQAAEAERIAQVRP